MKSKYGKYLLVLFLVYIPSPDVDAQLLTDWEDLDLADTVAQEITAECDSIFDEFHKLMDNSFITLFEEAPYLDGKYLYISNQECDSKEKMKVYTEFFIDTNGVALCYKILGGIKESDQWLLRPIDVCIKDLIIKHIEKLRFSPAKQRGKKIRSIINCAFLIISDSN